MRREGAARAAWAIVALTLILSLSGLALGLAHYPEAPLYDVWFEGTIGPPIFAIVGALIVARRPDNIIGWLFLTGLFGGVQMLSGSYATAAVLDSGSNLVGGEVAAWISQTMQFQFVGVMLFLILLFPTGSLVSPVWKPIAWLVGISLGVSAIAVSLEPGPLENVPFADNPFGIEAADAFLEVIGAIGGIASVFCVMAAIASMVVRYRRARGDARLQIKWFVFAATLSFSFILISNFVLGGELGHIAWTVGPLSLPVTAGIAVLRYRLYEIDRIINKSLVYGGLTALLVAGYAGSVLLLQTLLPIGNDSAVAVAVSTLAMAALFGPLRNRVQAAVDRRFYRGRYDAVRMVEGFSRRLRDQTDLNALADDLLEVVDTSVHPMHASLWLRPRDHGPSLR